MPCVNYVGFFHDKTLEKYVQKSYNNIKKNVYDIEIKIKMVCTNYVFILVKLSVFVKELPIIFA